MDRTPCAEKDPERRLGRVTVIAWLVLSLASGPATGWLVGDRSVRPFDDELDPPPLLGRWAGAEPVLGLILTGSAVVAAAALVVLSRRGRLSDGWGPLSAATTGLAAATGAAYRVWAGRVDGANIGGATLLWAFPAVIAAAVLLAVWATAWVRSCSLFRAAIWVTGGYALVVQALALTAEATDTPGLRVVFDAYTYRHLPSCPTRLPHRWSPSRPRSNGA